MIWALASGALAAAAAFATSALMRSTPPPALQTSRFVETPPAAQALAISSLNRDLAIAPDGAIDRNDVRKLLKSWNVELDDD